MRRNATVHPTTLQLLRWFGHQHWIPRGRDRVIRLFANPDHISSMPFDVDFFGLRYRGNLQSFIDWHVYFYGCWARNELLLIRSLIDAARDFRVGEFTAADIGANVGNHSLFFSAVCDRVFAFEPYEPVRSELDEKIAYNRCENVTVFPVGLGEADEELEYSIEPGANAGEGSFVLKHSVRLKLPVRNGDAFFRQNALPKIDLMKIDVEGYEGSVFRGLRESIRRDRPIILSELSRTARSGIGSEEDFRELIPPHYLIAEVGTASISGPYRLKSFSYKESREFVAIPEELLPFATRRIPELARVNR